MRSSKSLWPSHLLSPQLEANVTKGEEDGLAQWQEPDLFTACSPFLSGALTSRLEKGSVALWLALEARFPQQSAVIASDQLTDGHLHQLLSGPEQRLLRPRWNISGLGSLLLVLQLVEFCLLISFESKVLWTMACLGQAGSRFEPV